MKKTISSIIIGLALTAVANGQRSLTLKDINYLYENAVISESNDLRTKIIELQVGYAKALNAYRVTLLTRRDESVLAIITALDAEVKNVATANDGELKLLADGADAKIVSLRKTYEEHVNILEAKSDKQVERVNKTLVLQLEALKESHIRYGRVAEALVVHERLVKLGVADESEPTDDTDPIDEKSVVITKEFGGYASAVSKQKLRLEEGAEYTLTFLAKLGGKEDLSSHDCLPRFSRGADEKDFEGGDKNKMRRAQRASEERKISNAGKGWSKVTVKFTHHYDEPVVFGVVFYDTEDIQISMRDFTLIDAEGKNLITKDLNSSRGWEDGDFVSFTK